MPRATRAEINIKQFQHNISVFRSLIKQKKLCLVLKGNAYGHGIVSMAKYAEDMVDCFAVAIIEEGIQLRESGITHKIFIMSPHLKSNIPLLCQYNLTPFISHGECLDVYQYWAEYYKQTLSLHLKVDTGMGRSGVMSQHVLSIAQQINKHPNLFLEGICTHFATADEEGCEFTQKQINVFNQVLKTLQENGITPPLVHAANTAAIIGYPDSHFTLVRLGIGAYGYANHHDISPVLSFKSNIAIVKTIPKGYSVSYGCTWKTDKETTIGIIPVGYADGYMRALSHKSKVMIDGELYPVIGRICMDQIVVELPLNSESWLEKEVLLFGNTKEINATTIANWADTISYEVLTAISTRVPRIYNQ